MALGVDLSAVTAADGTFSVDGAAAWLTVKDRTATLTGVASLAQGGTGNTSGTATVNANLTGIVTSIGNATAIADKAIALAKLADGTAGNLITYNASGVVAAVDTGTATHVLTSNGPGAAPTFQAAGGGATLDGITAATASQAGISNGAHTIRWNFAQTADAKVSFEFGESAASTGGTSTSGVPNQVIGKFSTLAASTASPLSVWSRGNFVFAVSPTTRQILATDGSASAPPYGFASSASNGHGMYFNPDTANVQFSRSGLAGPQIALTASGTVPGIGLVANRVPPNGSEPLIGVMGAGLTISNTGLNFTTTVVAVNISGVENSQFLAGAWQPEKGTDDAVGYAVNFRKARGTVASPTVITTGDDLATINAAGYVGATGTYVTAATITADSNGTIANDATGVGGIWRFATRKVAGVVTERMTIDNNETADETSILVSINGAAPVRVSKGANDSGGSGFALLRIPN